MKKIITLTAFAFLAFSVGNANAQTAPSCSTLGYTNTAAACAGKNKVACPTDETKFFCGEICDANIYKYDSINCPSSKNTLGGDKYSKCTCVSNNTEVFPEDYTECAEYDSCTYKCIRLGDCRTLGSEWKGSKYISGTNGDTRTKNDCPAAVKIYTGSYQKCYASGRSLLTSADYAAPNGWKLNCVRCITATDASKGITGDAGGKCVN
ncbi:MAG: hypothetical protein ACK5N8_02490 [Alphaproteobacteria bacterium]